MEFSEGSRVKLVHNALLWIWDTNNEHQGNAVPGYFRIDERGRIFDLHCTKEPCPFVGTCSAIDAKGHLVIPGYSLLKDFS
jgi:hypothetical protein